ncbi:MAG: DNA polymerase subunit Cdc27 [Benjaminiella poitrasii]|nr:MAG: DNA polymerase subunit Cdc27 [Benjaminiella poitrasii]
MGDYNEYLNITVIQENRPVTYKSLARSLGIHVNAAKQALYDFSKNQTNVQAVYCITGKVLQNNHFSIQLVKDSDLEEAKKKYKEITGIHVYSLTSFDPDDFSILYTACKEAPRLALEDRVKCGILRNTNVHQSNVTSNRLIEKKDQPVMKNNTTLTKPISTPTSNKATSNTATPSSTGSKRKGTLSFGPVTTKKQAVAKPSKTKPEKTEKPASYVKKSNKSTIKNDNDDIEKRMARTTLKASDIFSDDEDDNMSKPLPIEDMKTEEKDDDIVMEDANESSEITDSVEPSHQKEQQVLSSTANPVSNSPSKARRKVLKKKTTKNARGFLVTEEVWEWESADESEMEPSSTAPKNPPKPAASATKNTPKKNASATSKKPASQSNLLNFFKKA